MCALMYVCVHVFLTSMEFFLFHTLGSQVLLHDFPEFLSEHHFVLCNHIPPTCVQMRNLILSAFPRNMRLPDPFTPNLKVCVFVVDPTERPYPS